MPLGPNFMGGKNSPLLVFLLICTKRSKQRGASALYTNIIFTIMGALGSQPGQRTYIYVKTSSASGKRVYLGQTGKGAANRAIT